MDDRFAALIQTYRASLPSKRADIAAFWRDWAAAPEDAAAVAPFQSRVHQLAGSAASYGFVAIGDCARAIDAVLIAWSKADPRARESGAAVAASVAGNVEALLDALHNGRSE